MAEARDAMLVADDAAVTTEVAGHVSSTAARARAFDGLVQAGLDASYRLAAVILGDPTEAEDAVHDAATIAWRRWSTLRDESRFESWFARILVNVCRDRLRRRRRRDVVDLSSLDERTAPELRLVDDAPSTVSRLAVARSIAGLGADQRIVLVLRFYLDLSVPAIAGRLGVPEGTVKSRLHAALARVRHDLEDDR